MSTINSSLAADLVKQSATQNNLALDGNQTIHVGDVINNFYTPPSSDAMKSDSCEGSMDEFQDSLVHKNLSHNNTMKFIKTRKYWIGGLLILVGVSIGLSIYFALQDPQEDLPVSTETLPIESTSTESTPTESTDSTDSTEPVTESIINFIVRDDWLRGDVLDLTLPISRIIIAHTADESTSCFNEKECKRRVKMIRWNNIGLNDIPYNFFIGGDGSVIEGRGFRFEGEHTANMDGSSFNDIGICVAFIGTFNETQPFDKQIEGFRNFTTQYVNDGVIAEDHKIFFQDQLAKPKVPANALFEVVQTFDNFYSSKLAKTFKNNHVHFMISCFKFP